LIREYGERRPGADEFFEPAGPAAAELKVKKSLFIGQVFRCEDREGVRSNLARAEESHRDANHHCWAYALEPGGDEHASDAGEPAGTAGRPILSAIRKSGLFNVMIVVTRYFGGVKLGTRGLIDAYAQVASDAVARAERVLKIRKKKVTLRAPYPAIGDVTRLLTLNGMVGSPAWVYGSDAEAAAEVRLSSALALEAALEEFRSRKLLHSWAWAPQAGEPRGEAT
jgi:uncharacterized YigZ family protein